MSADPIVLREWADAAPFWDLRRQLIGQMFAPVSAALIEAAGIREGYKVLDVATGPGDPALPLALLVGPEGSVVGVDPVPEMVAAARREADRLALANVRFEVASADALPFGDSGFDTALSRFGVMFFPAPVQGVREMLRVVRPGGNLAFAVWHTPDRNPFFTIVERCLPQYIEPAPTAPEAPNSFRFAAPGKLAGVMKEAGVPGAAERLLRFTMEAPISAEDFWGLRRGMSDKLGGALARLSTEQLANVKDRALREVDAFRTPEGFAFPAEVLIVSGTKPF